MENLLEDLVKTAESFAVGRQNDGNFDYSRESLNDIDKFIEIISQNTLEPYELDIWTSYISSYVFEVARTINGGEYTFDEDTHQPVLSVKTNDSCVTLRVWSKLAGILNKEESGLIFAFIDSFSNEVITSKEQSGHNIDLM